MENIHAHVWDANLHLQDVTIKEADLSRGYPLDLTVTFDDFMADMVAFEKVAVFGLKAKLTGYWVPDEYVANFVKRAPQKLIGFAACDPTQSEYMDELKHAIERLNLVGLKMGPMYAGFDPRNQRCVPVYSYCQSKGIPIIFHTGTTFNRVAPLGFSRPWLFDEVAIRFPGLRMVLAHVAHPFYDECIAIIRKHPHVYADIAALYYRPWQFYNIMISAQEYKVTQKLLLGTDYPFANADDSINGVRNVNHIIGDSSLPRISGQLIEEILQRDTFGLLGVKT